MRMEKMKLKFSRENIERKKVMERESKKEVEKIIDFL
jgi:hypothetical protein